MVGVFLSSPISFAQLYVFASVLTTATVVSVIARGAVQPTTGKLVKIPAGRLQMGCADCGLADAEPVHPVDVSAFEIDETPVTNAQFAAFVAATRYVTIAERRPSPENYPGVPVDKLVAGSAVFSPPQSIKTLANALAWWAYVPGASWRSPEGEGSTTADRLEHPAVHIAYGDAEAFCSWANKRLPTEAEFEYAARGGLVGKRYSWGDELTPRGKWAANIWQGVFPVSNTKADGFAATSPVRAFPANGYGLYDMGGNVWHWTSDWYRPDTYARGGTKGIVKDPRGPETSLDPDEPGVAKRVQRGGSFLCSDRYCTRYLVGSRGKGTPDSAGSNIGFRCAKDFK
jgi:sulfatase modifying factor 1